jgi:hypothetical protein
MNFMALQKKTVDHNPLGLPRGRRLLLYFIAGGVWLSGLVWLIFRNFMQQETEFGVSPHPLEAWWRILHGVFSFASLWVFGVLWGVHITKGWSRHWRRLSGGTLVGFVLVLVLSGLGIYYIENQTVLSWVQTLHWVIGLAALVIFIVHWVSKSQPRKPRTFL